MADAWDNRQREKNKKAAGFLLLFLSVCVMGMVWYREEARQTMGKTEEVKKVALTFDDGPNPDYTGMLLDGLRERNTVATFFLLGAECEKYPEIVKKIAEWSPDRCACV